MKINILICRYLTVILYLALCPVSAMADTVDQYLLCEMHRLKIPGLSVAIVENGNILKSKGYGFSNIELQTPAKPETIYQSGSIGKQFTAMLAMILVEKGMLHLDEPLAKLQKH